MSGEKIPTIHRAPRTGNDWFPWFEYEGVRYDIRTTAPGRPQSNGDGYIIVRTSDNLTVGEGFYYISEIRDFLAQAVRGGWTTLEDTSEPEYVVKHFGS